MDLDGILFGVLIALGVFIVVAILLHGTNVVLGYDKRLYPDVSEADTLSEDIEVMEQQFAEAQWIQDRRRHMEVLRKFGNYSMWIATGLFVIMMISIWKFSGTQMDAPGGGIPANSAAVHAPYATF